MARLVQAVGVVLGISLAASFFVGRGNKHDYEIAFVQDGNRLTATKKEPEPHWVNNNPFKPTTWTFTKQGGADVAFELYEKLTEEPYPHCHFFFRPFDLKNPCSSSIVTLKQPHPEKIRASALAFHYDHCTAKSPCKSVLRARLLPDGEFNDVDPLLQIERDYRWPVWLVWLVGTVSPLFIGGPIVWRRIKSGRSESKN